jgi:hypothetical protein
VEGAALQGAEDQEIQGAGEKFEWLFASHRLTRGVCGKMKRMSSPYVCRGEDLGLSARRLGGAEKTG